ncbi:molecular chaperone [Pseudomonas sp. M5A4_2d]
MFNRWLRTVFGLALAAQMWPAHGEIVIDRTRIIYPAAAREVTVNLRNEADGPRLVQVWIDRGDPEALPELSDVPFTVSPPILRLEAGTAQGLRLAYHPAEEQANARPQESVYWLNVRGIRPTARTSNQLQFVFRTRIKLFLRPEELAGREVDAVQTLRWRLGGDSPVLRVHNPSAFHVTLSSVVLTLEGVEYPSEDPPMLLPRTTANLMLKGRSEPWQGSATLRFTTLDDHGVTREHSVSLAGPVTEDVAI